jgi:hypothetical protein
MQAAEQDASKEKKAILSSPSPPILLEVNMSHPMNGGTIPLQIYSLHGIRIN